MRVQSSKNDLSSAVYDETVEDGFHGFVEKTESFASAIGAVSIEIRSKRVVIFSQSNRRENLQNRTKPTNETQKKFRESCGSSLASKTAVKT